MVASRASWTYLEVREADVRVHENISTRPKSKTQCATPIAHPRDYDALPYMNAGWHAFYLNDWDPSFAPSYFIFERFLNIDNGLSMPESLPEKTTGKCQLSIHLAINQQSSLTLKAVNARNSDITFRSGDGVEFYLHRTLLEAHTGGFPGSEIDTQGGIIRLTEPAKILEILFDFVYPERHSDLVDTDVDLLFGVADAAEKYEVFSAMFVCNARLSAFLPRYPERILVHAVKHSYPRLIDEAAAHIPRSSFALAMEKLPTCSNHSWYRYQESWTNLFKGTRKYTKHMPLLKLGKGRIDHKTCHSIPGTICNICQNSMFLWISTLEEIETISSLNDTLDRFPTAISDTNCCKDFRPVTATDWAAANMMTYGCGRPAPGSPHYKCNHLLNLARSIQHHIKTLPPLSDFVNGRDMEKTRKLKHED